MSNLEADQKSIQKFSSAVYGSFMGDSKNGGAFSQFSSGGERVLSPNDKKALEAEISRLVAIRTDHMTTEQRGSARGKAVGITKAIVQSPYIAGSQEGTLLDVVDFGIDAAVDPSLVENTTIKVGYGGSDDPNLNARVLAYAVPALDLQRRLQQVTTGKSPKVEFAFAYNVGVETNGKKGQQAQENATNTARLIGHFIQEFYPEAQDYVTFTTDKPPSQFSPYANEMIAYCRSLIEETISKPDEDKDDLERRVSAAIKTLTGMSANHGTGVTEEEAQERAIFYSIMHPIVFGDHMSLPYDKTFHGKRSDTKGLITIGGKPERIFNEMRMFLSRATNAQQFADFASNHSTDYQTAVISRWAQMYERADLATIGNPQMTLPLLTGIGKIPVYFGTKFDIPVTGEGLELLQQGQTIIPVTEKPDSVQRDQMKAVSRDLEQLIQATGGAENLAQFYKRYI